mgnify:CR=1 FL=1
MLSDTFCREPMPQSTRQTANVTLSRSTEPFWARYSDEALLDVRMCDLGVLIAGTRIEQRIEKVYDELAQSGLQFRPHCWLSDEWFTPDGVPGIAIPFYLAHPRLERLECKQMLEVEGGSQSWCLRILRHEVGHALDNAYRLGRRKAWQRLFGNSTRPYPDHYSPKPYSKSFVQHLGMWYAQAHPSEDFAETFAVWLRPRSNWSTQYTGWDALSKLQYVDHLMDHLSDRKPVVVTRKRVDPVRKLRKTLREHYEEKKDRYGVGIPSFYDRDLLRLFSDERKHARNMTAAMFLRSDRRSLRDAVGPWTGQHPYTIDQVVNELVNRCRELKLRLRFSERETRRHILVLLTVQTMNVLHGGQHRVAI